MIVAAGSSLPKSSFSKERSHIASFVAWVSPMYSASHEDRATTVCLLDDQLIAPLPNVEHIPSSRSSGCNISSPIRVSVSKQWFKGSMECQIKVNSSTKVVQDPLDCFDVWLPGFAKYRLQAETANAISGQIPSIAYINDPTALAYQSRSSSVTWYPSGMGSSFEVSIGVAVGLHSHIPKSLSSFSMYPC